MRRAAGARSLTSALTHSSADNNHDQEFLIFSALYEQHKILKAYLSASRDTEQERERDALSRVPRMLFILHNTKKTQNSGGTMRVHKKNSSQPLFKRVVCAPINFL
jgi:hypothetical protein